MKCEFSMTIDDLAVKCYFNSEKDLQLSVLPLTRMMTMLCDELGGSDKYSINGILNVIYLIESKCGYKVITKVKPNDTSFSHTPIEFEVCEGTIACLLLDD